MKVIELSFLVNTPILACGADMKGAFALAKGKKAYLMDGFGDLSDPDNLARYEKAIRAAIKKLGIRPAIVVCDFHPDYFSSRFAESYFLTYAVKSEKAPIKPRRLKFQHHEAHIASAIIDNSLKGDVIGIAFDGTGYGSDGHIWGGEFFAGNVRKLGRAAHLEYIPMPGADMAVKEPWRMAASYLYKAFGDDFLKFKIDFVKGIDKNKWQVLKKMIDRGVNSPLTSSMGRLFDAAASVILARREAAFEAELPIALEKHAAQGCVETYNFDIIPESGELVIEPDKIMRGVVKDLRDGVDTHVIAAKFHNAIADVIHDVVIELKKPCKINSVVLSGGVFQNAYLLKRAKGLLEKSRCKVYSHSRVPTNDAGIPLGQIAIANARIRCA